MLRVEIYDVSKTMYLRVEGRFVSAYAEDLRGMVMRCKFPSRLVVDVSNVTFVDAGGEKVLLWLGRIGAQFVANSCYSLGICETLRLPTLKRESRTVRSQAC
jgi:hypothetical protein